MAGQIHHRGFTISAERRPRLEEMACAKGVDGGMV
jgi:hypothetical protein